MVSRHRDAVDVVVRASYASREGAESSFVSVVLAGNAMWQIEPSDERRRSRADRGPLRHQWQGRDALRAARQRRPCVRVSAAASSNSKKTTITISRGDDPVEAPRDHATPPQVPHFTKQYNMMIEALAKTQKLDRAEPTSRGKAHDDERMMQFMFTNRPLEKVPCQLAEEFKVRLKTALTQRSWSAKGNMVKIHGFTTPSTPWDQCPTTQPSGELLKFPRSWSARAATVTSILREAFQAWDQDSEEN